MRRLLFTETNLDNLSSPPSGYRYIGFNGSTFSVQSSTDSLPIGIQGPQGPVGPTGSGSGQGSSIIELTYQELYDIYQNENLSTGSYYIITDFKSCYDQPDYDIYKDAILSGNYKVGNTHSIIVFATSNNSLSSDAFQPDYPNDKIKYDIRYNSTYTSGATAFGRITERIDEWENRTDYDHREISFKRYRFFYHDLLPLAGRVSLTSDGQLIGTNTDFEVDFSIGDFVVIPSRSEYVFQITTISSSASMGLTGVNMPEVFDVEYHRGRVSDFGYTGGYNQYYANNIDGLSDYREFKTFYFEDETIINNKMGNYYTLLEWGEYYFDLPNNVFGEDCINNVFGNGCYNNTIISDIEDCFIGNYFSNNIYSDAGSDFDDNHIGNYFRGNIIMQEFSSNKIGNFFTNNFIRGTLNRCRIGDYFDNNIIDSDFQQNKIGTYFNNNKIYYQFNDNTIGDQFYNNTFYNNFYKNIVDFEFNNNTIGEYENRSNFEFYENTIRDQVKSNLFKKDVRGNYIGSEFSSNQTNDLMNNNFGNYCVFNNLGQNFEENIVGNSFTSNDISDYFTNNTIGNYFDSNDISTNFSFNKIGNNFYNNSIGNNFGISNSSVIGNIIGNYFQNNNIRSDFYNNNISDFFKGNLIGSYFQSNDIKAIVDTINFVQYYGNIRSISDNTGASPSIPGTDGVYIGLTAVGPTAGNSATFDVIVSGSSVQSVSLNSGGFEYLESDSLVIDSSKFGGVEGNDIVIDVTGISGIPVVYTNTNSSIVRNQDGNLRLYYLSNSGISYTDIDQQFD